VTRILTSGKQRDSVVVFDACFSGKTGDGAAPLVSGLQATLPVRKSATAAATSVAVILSSSETFAGPLPGNRRPAFSYVLLGALRGWADTDKDQAVTVDEAFAYTQGTLRAALKASDRLPSMRGQKGIVFAKNLVEEGPDVAAILSGRCPEGTNWGERRCEVVACPAGMKWIGAACAPIAAAIACPKGTSYNGTACASSEVACPAGTSWDGAACRGSSFNATASSRSTAPAGKSSMSSANANDLPKELLSRADVLLVVKANMGAVESCGHKNNVGGVIKMSFKIEPSGKTREVAVADSKFAGTPVGTCVANEIKKWRFPASQTFTPVSYPMKLSR
jgi:hypothetical protein